MMKIAIASGKGGTGKTFLSSNLFRTMVDAGVDTAIVDCDAEVPNEALFLRMEKAEVRKVEILSPEIDASGCLFCGKCAEWCPGNAITCIPAASYIRIMPDICHGCGACLHACPHGAVKPFRREAGSVTGYTFQATGGNPRFFEARTREGVHSPVPVIRQAISWGAASDADYLILDAPPGCACPFVSTVLDADKVILVTEPTPFGLSDLKQTVAVLRELGKDFGVVINRSDLGDGSLKAYLASEGIRLLAEIPYSETIAAVYARGGLVVDEDSRIKELFTGLAEHLLSGGPQGQQGGMS